MGLIRWFLHLYRVATNLETQVSLTELCPCKNHVEALTPSASGWDCLWR